MAFKKAKEFKRQLDFQKDRIIDALKQSTGFFERRDMVWTEIDEPVEIPDTGYDDTESYEIHAITRKGVEVYYQGTLIEEITFKELKEKYNNELLTELLDSVEKTMSRMVQQNLDF